MPVYMISYDNPSKDYDGIVDFLTGEGAVRILESVWLVSYDLSADTLRKMVHVSSNNTAEVAVLEIDVKKPASVNLDQFKGESEQFLEEHFSNLR